MVRILNYCFKRFEVQTLLTQKITNWYIDLMIKNNHHWVDITSLIYTQNKLLLNILALRKMIKIILILHDKDNINFTIKDL